MMKNATNSLLIFTGIMLKKTERKVLKYLTSRLMNLAIN